MKMNESHWTNFCTLDEASECLPVSAELSKILWNLLVEDDSDKWEYPDQKLESPNIIAKVIARGKLSMAQIAELNRAHDAEYPTDPVECSDCGRILKDEESVRLGIGPVCGGRQRKTNVVLGAWNE